MADRDPWEAPAAGAAPERDPWEAPRAAPAAAPWDIGTEAMNAAMLGYGPQINGLLGGNAAADRAAHQAFDAAHPYQALGANLVGGAVPAAAMTMAGVPPVAAGAIQGGANGYAETGNPVNAALGAGVGALGAGATQGIGALARYLGILPKVAPTVAAVPTPQQALDAGGQGFNALRATGAEFPGADVASGARSVAADLNARGSYGDVGQSGAPTTHAILNKQAALGAAPAPDPMQAVTGVAPGGPPAVPIERLDAIRTALGGVRPGASTSMRDAAAARQAAEGILDIYASNPVISALSADARGNYAAGMTGRQLEDYAESAANGAQNTGIGMNAGNKFRQAAGAAIKSDDFDAQPDVRAALQATNDGTAFQNLMRRTGTALGGGGGPLSTLIALGTPGLAATVGHETMGLPGLLLAAVPPTIGHIAKTIDNNAAKANFQAAIDTAMRRAPLYAQNAANFVPPRPPFAPGAVPATIGGLLGAYVSGSGQ